MKTTTICYVTLVLLISASSCSKKDDVSTHYDQEEDVNSSPSSFVRSADANALTTVYDVNSGTEWRIRSADIRDMNPLEFLSHLLKTERKTVQIAPVQGWVKEADLSKLFALLDSQDKCASVIAPHWSPSMDIYRPSAVGREAGFLIRFFRMKGIPGSGYHAPLSVTMSDAEKEDLRKWWAQYQDEKD